MKRLTQFVAVVVIGLMAVAPALASLPCTTGVRAACAIDCPMAMSGMGTDCTMARPTATGDCPQNCCASGVSQAVVSAAAPEKLRLAAAVSSSVAVEKVAAPGLAVAIYAPDKTRVTSPPHYLLNRTFRI